MENLIFFSIMLLSGFICIIFPSSVAQLLSGFSWFSDKQSKARNPIVRLMGVTIIIIAISMFYGQINV
jgi:hypothetical protein